MLSAKNFTNGPGSACRTSKLTEEQAQAILDAQNDGAANELARKFGVTSTTAMAIRRRKTWHHLKRNSTIENSHGLEGAQHRRAKITQEQAQQIVDAENDDAAAQLGISFGLSGEYAIKIHRGHAWKCLRRMKRKASKG